MTASILIVRPLITLIHGIWSNWRAWNNFSPLVLGENSTDSRFSVLRANYDDIINPNTSPSVTSTVPTYSSSLLGLRANTLGFAFNAQRVFNQISDRLGKFRLGQNPANSPVAAAQIDVIAHSMGGTIARTLPLIMGYSGDPNYNQGLVHKVITIDTPHLGSPLAKQLLGQNSDCVREQLSFGGQFSFSSVSMNSVNGTVSGAVGDLQGDGVSTNPSSDPSRSPALKLIAQPGPYTLPTALTAGIYTNFASLDSASAAKFLLQKCGQQQNDPLGQEFTSAKWPQIFGSDGANNDAVVDITSQLNGLSSSFQHVGLVHSKGVEGLGFTGPSVLDSSATNPIANDVITLLNTPVTQQSVFNRLNP